MIGNRRRARECALQLLYQDEFHSPVTRTVAISHFWEDGEGETLGSREEVRDFTAFLVDGVREHQEELDGIIRRVARNWKLERMSRVDRNILRVATFELLYAEDIPPKVSLNEAIEIAKSYGAEDSGAFINGILDKISREVASRGEVSEEGA